MSTIKTNQLAHTANGAATYTLPQTDGSSGQVLQTNGSGVLSWTTISSGLSMADSWRITANVTGDVNPLTNWERFDTSPWESNLGTGMSESSGVFTFPSTGYYFLAWSHYIYRNGNSSWNEMELQLSNDGGSNYTAMNHTEMFTTIAASTVYAKATETALLDITNVSNQKFRFKVAVDDNSVVTLGNTSKKQTGFDVFKLGDT